MDNPDSYGRQPKDEEEVIPWSSTWTEVRLIERDGIWIIQHKYKVRKKEHWSVGVTATDYDFSLWQSLEQERLIHKQLLAQLEKARTEIMGEIDAKELQGDDLKDAGDERGELKMHAEMRGLIKALAIIDRQFVKN